MFAAAVQFPPRGKSAEAFRTISEVAVELDVPQHVLRFWESRFAQVRPTKRAGGRRYYRPEDIDLLRGIRKLLYSDGYTIKGVQKVLRDKGLRYVAEIGRESVSEAPPPTKPAPESAPRPILRFGPAPEEREKLQALLAELLHLKKRLVQARQRAGG